MTRDYSFRISANIGFFGATPVHINYLGNKVYAYTAFGADGYSWPHQHGDVLTQRPALYQIIRHFNKG